MRAEAGTLCRLSPCHRRHQRAASGWRVFEVRLKKFIKRLNLDSARKAICFEIEIDFLGPWNLAIPRRWSSLKNSPAFKPCTARDNPMQSNAIHCRWIVLCSPHLENAIRVGIGDEFHHPCMFLQAPACHNKHHEMHRSWHSVEQRSPYAQPLRGMRLHRHHRSGDLGMT